MSAILIFIVCYMLIKLIAAIKGNDGLTAVIWGVGLVLVILGTLSPLTFHFRS